MDAALSRQKSSQHKKRRLDGEKEAHLIALACSSPPEGHARWTIRLLADKMVELELVESISPETVRQTLKKNDLKLWLNKSWVIPPEANAAEIEFSVLGRQCLDCRIPDKETLLQEVAAFQQRRSGFWSC